ncbi:MULTISPECIES: NAD(P)/FAD-dependent oxidoreductase [Saccharothrix]|uniref:NAD(P)/FAD-dependent oxidoreductase n=1 Tax=Saccharothrix TaxID=2071 RepID=UPI00093CA4A1|nr:FAD-dependent monooxygenase [Saccharothrix sp. CB00851]OKI36425.1 hypothetical protein A6A25_22055 [Saccharothrix sp. CB00851]
MSTPAVVVGGSTAGLATALALARRGCPVRVLERAAPPPRGPAAEAVEWWSRPTVPQSGHSHVLTSLGVRVLRDHAPDVLDAALEEGAVLLDLATAAPPGTPDPAEDELVALAVRRPVLDLVLRRAVEALPGVTISWGTTVRGVIPDPAGSRVSAVVTDRGERVPARFVVDATGRKALSRSWLADAGVAVPEDVTSPTGIRCFTRFYRLHEPGALPGPLNRGNAAGGIWDHCAAIVHLADDGVFAITVGTPSDDRATAVLRRPEAFTTAARLTPHVAAWAAEEVATPLTPVRVMATPPNALRGTLAPGGRPVGGLFPVGDAACVTDPLYGRGLSLALRHAFLLAELLDTDADPERVRSAAEGLYRPWFTQSVHDGAARREVWRAAVEGTAPRVPPPPAGRPALAAVARAAATDRSVWRGLTRMLMSLAPPEEVFDDPGFRDRVRSAPDSPAGTRPPTRAELLWALGAAEAA